MPAGAMQFPSAQEPAVQSSGGSLDIRIHPAQGRLRPPAQLLVQDPHGRKTGTDPRLEKTYQEIPLSYAETESLADHQSGEPGPETAIVYISSPQSGRYGLQVIGAEAGEYDLEIRAEDRDLNPSDVRFTHLRIEKGAVHACSITYSSEPGSRLEVAPVGKLPPRSVEP